MLLRQACRSLAEAHERGLVHRDIKPANLFVTRLGTEYDYVKVLDFGVVKEQSGHDATMLSNQGMVQGTPAFMPPEIVMGETRIDGRADLYSLACTAYWALTCNTFKRRLLPPSEAIGAAYPRTARSDSDDVPRERSGEAPSSALQLESELARVPCDERWTNERAQKWWEVHAPEVVGE